MQATQNSFLKLTPQIITNKFHRLFEARHPRQEEKLLTPQPIAQRELFLKWAIDNRINAHFQLMPLTNDGYPVNVVGRIKRLTGSNKYLITDNNVNYVVAFDQIRYIANL